MITFVDGHCDTVTTVMEKNEGLFSNKQHIDIVRLKNFESPVQVFSIWLHKKYHDKPLNNTIRAIDFFYDEINKYGEHIAAAFSYDDIVVNKRDKKISAILSIEGGEALEGEISTLRVLERLGVRMLTLTWNHQNELGSGILTSSEEGLTDFGRSVVCEMEKLNMIVDVSHLNEAGFWDVYRLSEKPFVASHSNAYRLCRIKRNLTDEQIKAVAEKGGIIGINLYPYFLCESGEAQIYHIINHIMYIKNLVGLEYLGLGCDFDGIDRLPKGIGDVNSLIKIYEVLSTRIGDSNTEKIFGGNYLTLFERLL